eukprot:CAMPEP_0114681560 /NCGR_PEP_ID=MMETSP0191-20121206/55533_1 /TAXON_ID=126664 /ORGANISM="Sorites sp." /LENGTH=74 /DNA_ID=CAMNT_0001960031 /DNA_START=118 /DNA_END=339 /DNA_ORIENTATION=-
MNTMKKIEAILNKKHKLDNKDDTELPLPKKRRLNDTNDDNDDTTCAKCNLKKSKDISNDDWDEHVSSKHDHQCR